MHIQKLILSALLMTSCLTGFSQKYKGDSWATVKSNGSGTLTIIYIEQFGLIHRDKDGSIKGVCADILEDFTQYINQRYGKTVTIKYAGEEPVFSDFLNIVQTTSNILGVTNTTITEERKKIFKFSPPYMHNRPIILSHSSAPVVGSLKDLPQKFPDFTAQVIEGSTHVKYIEKIKTDYLPSLKITYADNGPAIIKNMVSNQKLFTVIDLTEFIEAVNKKLPVKRHPVDVGIVEDLGFIMSRQSDWDGLFKEFLTADYRNSVRYREIISKNLSATFLSLVK